jgi:hypothetical protein
MQNAPRIWLDYRPVRIGWVVPERDITRLATLATWNACLWGGRFNPVIPIHDISLADQLVKAFAVDILLPVDGTDATRAFTARFPYLGHDRWHERVFKRRQSEFADIRHVVRRIFRNQDKQAEAALTLPSWDPTDVLHPVFSLLFGQYPLASTDVADYRAGIRKAFNAPEKILLRDEEVSRDLLDQITPLSMTAYDMRRTRDPSGWLNPGVVLGSAADFDDLALFWNLRAAGATVVLLRSDEWNPPKTLCEWFSRQISSFHPRRIRSYTLLDAPRLWARRELATRP